MNKMKITKMIIIMKMKKKTRINQTKKEGKIYLIYLKIFSKILLKKLFLKVIPNMTLIIPIMMRMKKIQKKIINLNQ